VEEHTTLKIPKPVFFENSFGEAIHILSGSWRRSFKKTLRFLKYDAMIDLIENIAASEREGTYSRLLRGIVVPTRSFLGGLVTVQPTTDDVSFGDDDVWNAMSHAVGVDAIHESGGGHTFSQIANFGSLDGNILLRDFGDGYVPELLLAHRDSVRRELGKLSMGVELGFNKRVAARKKQGLR